MVAFVTYTLAMTIGFIKLKHHPTDICGWCVDQAGFLDARLSKGAETKHILILSHDMALLHELVQSNPNKTSGPEVLSGCSQSICHAYL